MPRKVSTMSIQELRRCLKAQEKEVARLEQKRAKLIKELAKIDKAIVAAGGPLTKTPVVRTRAAKTAASASGKRSTGKPLIDYLVDVLKGLPKGMRVKEVMNAATEAGYVSRSKDFYGIVATALREGPQFKKITRGIYALK